MFRRLNVAAPLLTAVTACAAKIEVATDRIAYVPGAQVTVHVSLLNDVEDVVSGKLDVTIRHDLDGRAPVLSRDVAVTPGKPLLLTVVWTAPRRELWGCEARAELSVADRRAALGRRVFVVSDDLPKTSANYGFTHPMALGRPTEANLTRTFDAFAKYAVPMVELFCWAPSPWGEIIPDRDHWINGQARFIMERGTIEGVIKHAHRRGMKAMAYAITWLNGPAGYRWARAHPEDVRYTTADAKLPALSDEELAAWEDAESRAATVTHAELRKLASWSAAVNASRDATVDRAIDEYIRVVKRFGFDGIRWDGHPGNWYHPIRDWWSRMGSGGKKPYTPGYDWQGNLLTPDDPDAENRRTIRRVRRRLLAALPALIEGYNIQAWNAFKPDTPEVVEANLFPLSYSEFVPGNVMLDEKHYHTRADGTPTMHTTWAKTRKVLRRGNELVQRFGAHHYTGGMPNSGAGPFLLHAHSLAYALGVRTFGGGNHYGKYPSAYEAFLAFSQRYARYLFHPSRLRFLPEHDDETTDRVSVHCGRPVVHRPFCYYLATNRTFTLIVQLWNQPLSEKMNVKHCDAPPVAADAVVTLQQPLGMIHERGRAYVLSPEWDEWQEPAAIDATLPTVSVPVPAFRYWAMVVVQYPMIPANIDKPAHHWFLPVQE